MMLTCNGSQSQFVSSGDSYQSVYGDNQATAARKVHVQEFTLDLILTFSFFVKQSKTTEFSVKSWKSAYCSEVLKAIEGN